MYYLHDIEHLKAEQPDIFQAVENLRSYSALGAALMEWAEANNIGIKVDPDLWCAGVMRGWNTGNTHIVINPESGECFEKIIAHELFHAVQMTCHGLRLPNSESSLHTALRTLINCEAGAETAGIRACYEMKLNGFDRPFEQNKNAHPHIKGYGWLAKVFEKSFENAKGGGRAVTEALDKASSRTALAYTENSELAKTYGQKLMFMYMMNTHHEKYSHCLPTVDFSAADTKRFFDGPDGTSIAPYYTPEDEIAALKGKPEWRQMIDWADAQRMKTYKDITAETSEKVQARLIQDKNPFASLTIKRVLAENFCLSRYYDIPSPGQAIFQAIGQAAGTETTRQMHLDLEPKTIKTPRPFPFS